MNNEERYKISLETAVDVWKFQVDSYWTRTSYFAVFELAFAAGLWKLFESKHFFTCTGMAIGAIFVTFIWTINNSRLHEYILYYWGRVRHFEGHLNAHGADSVFEGFDNDRVKRIPGEYHLYIQIIPVIFLIGWLWMLLWSVCELKYALKLH